MVVVQRQTLQGGKTRRKEADVVQGEVRWVGHGLNHEVHYGV